MHKAHPSICVVPHPGLTSAFVLFACYDLIGKVYNQESKVVVLFEIEIPHRLCCRCVKNPSNRDSTNWLFSKSTIHRMTFFPEFMIRRNEKMTQLAEITIRQIILLQLTLPNYPGWSFTICSKFFHQIVRL